MEHEVFVPVTTELLRGTLADPARVARCVPGLQQDADADAGPLAGRLRIRVGGHTITYRGALRLAGRGDAWTVEGEGTEARGSGSVKLALTLRLTPTEEGATLAFSGTAGAEGRLVELPADTVDAAARRLLDRFAAALGAEAERAEEAAARQAEADDEGADAAEESGDAEAGAPPAAGHDLPVPPPSVEPLEPLEPLVGDEPDAETAAPDFVGPPAEAAHARRTMIGRSAEEVDHAPPRGRYAPVPAPETARAGATLRWVAPAAALALASAVVVGRALRRRR
ncbi:MULTISPECIES: SRPBCC domain-containing protein [Streptomyces]|uniref:SRPBCC domain-containing protein n=1 Tax=Streptomyces solicathayae TaxID=3081768 RepID=A0ABZ0LUG4_9ACTN|nr:SRPBCC domain-containing protein [Streptomyces sp. HUAS YS2]WOX23062.1 SRPBCC domain-containing protein [Streptomyces sp. HUAS YS2]